MLFIILILTAQEKDQSIVSVIYTVKPVWGGISREIVDVYKINY